MRVLTGSVTAAVGHREYAVCAGMSLAGTDPRFLLVFTVRVVIINPRSVDSLKDSLRILFLGEIVGRAGVYCVKRLLPRIKRELDIDFTIANGDGATGGYGIGKNHSIYIHKLGVDVITSGECIYYKKDMVPHIGRARYMLRPVNYPSGNPGFGWSEYAVHDVRICVMNMLGTAGSKGYTLKNSFFIVNRLQETISQKCRIIVVDFHAATTAEKRAMDYLLDGKVSALVGTHSRVPTADETVLPAGTASITDVGRTGSLYSAGGLDPEIEIRRFLTQIPEYSKDCWDTPVLQGVFFDIDRSGRATRIERVHYEVEENEDDTDGSG